MAKHNVVIVYGESFKSDSPRERKERAEQLVKKTLASGASRPVPVGTCWIDELLDPDAPIADVKAVGKPTLAVGTSRDAAPWLSKLQSSVRSLFRAMYRVVLGDLVAEAITFDGNVLRIDGLTPDECLARYELFQRTDPTDGSCDWREWARTVQLTAAQLVLAQHMWSAELRKRVDATRANEPRIRVDIQDID